MAMLDSDAYLKERIDNQLKWLSKASRDNKKNFLLLRILEVILGTGITIFSPFATQWEWKGALTMSLAGGGIAVCGSLLALYHHQENWLRYRSLAEALKREKYLFLTKTLPYDEPSTAFQRLVSNCESLLSAENNQWSQQMSKLSEAKAAGANKAKPRSNS